MGDNAELIDLHVHTDRSDGSTPPGELVQQARALGIRALGIADHDTLAGYDAARPFAAECGLELVCAVELSTRPEQRSCGKRERSVPQIVVEAKCVVRERASEHRAIISIDLSIAVYIPILVFSRTC